MSLASAANGKWTDILTRLGVDIKFLSGKQCPCPMCGGKDRFKYDNQNRGTYFCRGCGSGNGWNLLRNLYGWDYDRTIKEVSNIVGDCRIMRTKKKNPKFALKKVAYASEKINRNSDLVQYLNNRGISVIPDMLREASLYYFEEGIKTGPFPTLVALITDKKGIGVSYHLTYTHRQQKLKCSSPKKVMTPVGTITGSYIELFPMAEHIHLAEGIETSLAIHELTEMPVISCLNAQNLSAVDLPDLVKKVEIWGDNDSSYCGQRASYTLAERLNRKGIEVTVHIPPVAGEDWLDFINRNKGLALEHVKNTNPEFHQGITKLMSVFNTDNVTITKMAVA
ncbi:MAG TPA: hypothetical protein EYN33_05955 [Gammaproteobacteria bacterium]|nr:hypothetical protein [Gammaproteobacteria bacterium]